MRLRRVMRMLGGLALACGGLTGCLGPEQVACEEACDTLVGECGFAAYPDRTSCMEGCLNDADQGAPVSGLSTCVYEAECDPFEVVACSRAYGAGEE